MPKKKKPFAEHDLRVTLECAGKKNPLQNTTCASRLSAQVKKKPFAEHDLRVTLECAGNKGLASFSLTPGPVL